MPKSYMELVARTSNGENSCKTWLLYLQDIQNCQDTCTHSRISNMGCIDQYVWNIYLQDIHNLPGYMIPSITSNVGYIDKYMNNYLEDITKLSGYMQV